MSSTSIPNGQTLSQNQKSLLEFVEVMAQAQKQFKWPINSATLLLKHGVFFSPTTKPKHVRWGERGLCFMNAATLALADRTLTYVEGYAHCGLLPVEHAWVVDDEGNLIDNTWPKLGQCYYGVAITEEGLRRSLVHNGYYGLFGGMGRMPYIFTLEPKAMEKLIKKLKETT